ncbi:hypothetical protein LTR05_003729 [Lithohypha guttulata]|uniref:GP-PDE domain-containing protein n=1 Tax=Lithohypha guttulata TaxID=1690604 RepID=A0AAN7T0G5_9EURO|nr:hypothetical protein LTR05_003729 [Lithohypha guttulata]
MATTDDVVTPLLQAPRQQGEKAGLYTQSSMSSNRADDPAIFTLPTFTQARVVGKRKLPQSIAHRGFKAKCPENTMCAFKTAIEKGRAHAIETDIHLSKDNVVVLSHDTDLKRCFGRQERIIECDWQFLSQLRTIKAPHEPMPRLQDLLEYIANPELQHIWILLDIKLDNDADSVMRLIAETLASVSSGPNRWPSRVVLGFWAAKYLDLCAKYLPEYPVANIGFSTCHSRQFLKVPHVGFNMFAKALYGPIGTRFIKDVQAAGRPLYIWTVNEPNIMRWGIAKGVDGVITDNPELFNQICDDFDPDRDSAHITLSQWLSTFWLYIMLALFSIPLRHRLAGSADSFLKRRQTLKVKSTLALGA